MSIHHAILGLLALGDRCGYEMRRELEDFDRGWRIDYGQLYRLLNKLESQRAVESRNAPGQGGPNRKVYRLTSSGREELEHWLADPEAKVTHERDEFYLKLEIGRALGTEGLDALIESRRRLLETRRAGVIERRDCIDRSQDLDRWLVAETRRQHVEGSLEALDAYRTLLDNAGSDKPAKPTGAVDIVAAGSDDPILERLGQHLVKTYPDASFSTRPLGSLGGLLALREQRAHLAGTHLIDVETGEYNVAFVKRLLFEEPVLLVNLSHREQGLMVASGNPKNIRGIEGLTRSDLTLINRQRGAGTRLLLHSKLKEAGIDTADVRGWSREGTTHDSVAEAIVAGDADLGMGIRAVADKHGLELIPIGQERYDLAIPKILWYSHLFTPLREVLEGSAFREELGIIEGYDLSRMGEIVAEVC